MKIEYEPIKNKKESPFSWFSTSDFSPEKSNNIIKNLIKKIEEYVKTRELKVRYETNTNSQGRERIIKAIIKSKDKVIEGLIEYNPKGVYSLGTIGGRTYSGYIQAEFNFNSTDPKDRQEYLGLVRIIKSM